MQEPTKPVKTSSDILNADFLHKLDPRKIIFIFHQATGKEQALAFWVYQDHKLQHFTVGRQQDNIAFLLARNYLNKNHELFDEIYLANGAYIHIKKFTEPKIDASGKLTIRLGDKDLSGPSLSRDATTVLSCELGRREIYITDLCSIDFLDTKVQSHKIIRKYFGEIGLKYYKRSKACGRRCILDVSMQRLAQSRRRTDLYPFIREINQVLAIDLIAPKFTDEIELFKRENTSSISLEKFIYDRYYYSLINDDETQLLVALIRVLYDSAEDLERLFTPESWTNAVNHVRFTQRVFYVLPEEDRIINSTAYNLYRARYIVEKLGSRKIKNFLNSFFNLSKISQNTCNFSTQLSKLIEDDIDKLFFSSEHRELSSDNPYGEILRYPIIVYPPKSQIGAILHNIEHITPEQMTDKNLQAIAYFFANFWFLSAKKEKNLAPSLALYAATRIIRTIPQNSPAAPQAFYCAGDILNCIQMHLPERQLDYQKYLHDLFWPFMQSSVNFVKNYHHTEFTGETQESILDNALDWLIYLPDLNKINPELHQYLMELGQLDASVAIGKNTYDIYQAARCTYVRSLPAKERLAALKTGSEETLQIYYSDSLLLSDAKIIIPYLFDEKCEIESKADLLEDLVSRHKSPAIYDFTIRYVADHLPQLLRNFHSEDYPSGQSWALHIFKASCDGIVNVENIETLEYFASKLSLALIQSGYAHEFDSCVAQINLAFSGALKHIESFSFVSANTHFVGLN